MVYIILLIIIIPTLFVFFRQRLFDIDLKTFGLATFPDLKAAQWINENIVDEKKIYITIFLHTMTPFLSDQMLDGGCHI